jgi:hypothetical protein
VRAGEAHRAEPNAWRALGRGPGERAKGGRAKDGRAKDGRAKDGRAKGQGRWGSSAEPSHLSPPPFAGLAFALPSFALRPSSFHLRRPDLTRALLEEDGARKARADSESRRAQARAHNLQRRGLPGDAGSPPTAHTARQRRADERLPPLQRLGRASLARRLREGGRNQRPPTGPSGRGAEGERQKRRWRRALGRAPTAFPPRCRSLCTTTARSGAPTKGT